MNFAEPLKTIADNVPKVYQAGYDDGVAAGGGGVNPSEIVENLPIALDFSDGDQEIVAPDGVLVKSAIIQKPETLNPENIAEGVNIAGIVGTLAAGGGTSDELCYVTFMSYDGSVEYGKKAVAVGDDCADPIARGIFETPTRESDAQYNYTFYGWATEVNGAADSNWNKSITEDKTVYANFASAVRYYTITYYDSDGTTVLKTESLAYGSVPAYAPTKDEYDFVAWTPEPVEVTGETSYTATWKEKASFETATWAEIAAICDAGNAESSFKVGDRKPVTLTYEDGTTETIYFRIVDMGVDVKTDGTYAPLTLMADNLVKDSLQPASTYKTGANRFYSMDNAKARMTLLYNAMPADLKSLIKTVVKYHSSVWTYEQQVFIPSRKNLTGTEGTGSDYNATSINASILPQSQYAYFADGGSIERCKLSSASDDDYWTSTCRKYTSASYVTAYFETVDGISLLGVDQNAGTKQHGVCPCFCI